MVMAAAVVAHRILMLVGSYQITCPPPTRTHARTRAHTHTDRLLFETLSQRTLFEKLRHITCVFTTYYEYYATNLPLAITKTSN